MMKKLVSIIISITMIISITSMSFAAESKIKNVNEKDITVVPYNALLGTTIDENTNSITPRFINDYRYRKVNEKITYGWSPYKRISDNIVTKPNESGSISANREVTFGVDVSGDVSNLSFNLSRSVSNSKNYQLEVGPNRRVYLGYRVHYTIATGTREMYDVTTGKVVKRNNYTVKTPTYGEYALINY